MVVVLGHGEGLTGGQIGLLLALFSACILVGSVLGGAVRRRLSLRAVVMLEAYTGLLAVLFLLDPSVYVLAAAILPQAFVLPVTDSYVVARRIAVTPDHLQGRAEAARMTIVRTAAPLGALLAGILLSATSSRVAVGTFVALNAVEALYVTAAPAFRSLPD